jgi:WD40 repeat protein
MLVAIGDNGQGAEPNRSVIRHIAFSPDGEFIAVGGDDKFVYIVSHPAYLR